MLNSLVLVRAYFCQGSFLLLCFVHVCFLIRTPLPVFRLDLTHPRTE